MQCTAVLLHCCRQHLTALCNTSLASAVQSVGDCTLLCITVPEIVAHSSAEQGSAVHYNAVPISAVGCIVGSAVQCRDELCSWELIAGQCSAVQCSVVQCGAG